MSTIAIFTTVDSEAEARRIAAALVEQKLAACVQVSRIQSFYTWEGETQDEAEFRLMIKTVAERYAAVEAAVLELHPYELPAIYAVDLPRVHAPYAEWVDEHSRGP
jgi:periplasmic divalent cation tolerance protein